jgi:hypothetical protein
MNKNKKIINQIMHMDNIILMQIKNNRIHIKIKILEIKIIRISNKTIK